MPAGKELTEETEKVFYLRPVGKYTDRQGKKYEYTEQMRAEDLEYCVNSAKHYAKRFEQGLSEEHARGLIPFDVRQHWVMSANIRSLMHILALRGKKDAQEEIRQMCELILPHFAAWCPELYDWFMENQWLKGRLAP
jgi:thymidylate synthase (FAD)